MPRQTSLSDYGEKCQKIQLHLRKRSPQTNVVPRDLVLLSKSLDEVCLELFQSHSGPPSEN